MTVAELVERVRRLEQRVSDLEAEVPPIVIAEAPSFEEMHLGFVSRVRAEREEEM